MKRFDFVRPQTCEEAAKELNPSAVYMAGGTDLLGELKAGDTAEISREGRLPEGHSRHEGR